MIRCFGIQYTNVIFCHVYHMVILMIYESIKQSCYFCLTSDARQFCQMLHGTHFVSDVAWWGWCQIVLDGWSNKWVGERGGEAVISRCFSAASCYWLDIGKENKCFHKTLFFSCFICHFLRLFVTLQIILSYIQSHWVILNHLEFLVDTLTHCQQSAICNQLYSNFASENFSLYSQLFHWQKECNWIVLKV